MTKDCCGRCYKIDTCEKSCCFLEVSWDGVYCKGYRECGCVRDDCEEFKVPTNQDKERIVEWGSKCY
jgi:hypothetical protein